MPSRIRSPTTHHPHPPPPLSVRSCPDLPGPARTRPDLLGPARRTLHRHPISIDEFLRRESGMGRGGGGGGWGGGFSFPIGSSFSTLLSVWLFGALRDWDERVFVGRWTPLIPLRSSFDFRAGGLNNAGHYGRVLLGIFTRTRSLVNGRLPLAVSLSFHLHSTTSSVSACSIFYPSFDSLGKLHNYTHTHTHTHTQQLGRLIVQLWTIIDRFETARGAFLMKRQRCRRRAVFRFPHSISTRLGFPGSSSSSSSSSSSVMAKFSHGE